MRRRPPPLLLLAIIALLAASCGSRTDPLGAAAPAPQDAAAQASGTEGDAGSLSAAPLAELPGEFRDEPADPGRGTRPGSGEDPPGGGTDSGDDRGWENTMPLTLTLSASCVTRGGTMRATAVTEPGATMGFVASYSDNSYTPDFTYVPGRTNATGSHTWTWVIRPDTPLGDALAQVLVGKDSRGAQEEERFEVAHSC